LFDWDRRYAALSAAGDPLERLASVVEFELFRAELDAALDRSDRAKGGRPPYDPVLMFKVLVLQTLYTLSDDRVRAAIEHVFATQKCRLGMVIRSVGLARATTKLGLADLVTNMRRLVRFKARAVPA